MISIKFRTFNICMSYVKRPNCKTKRSLVRCLTMWSKDGLQLSDYGYTVQEEDDVLWHIQYCSDRMNSGRAKALLRLMNKGV